MIHIRIDDEIENSKRRFACGVGPKLPAGDTYYDYTQGIAYVLADCPGCNPEPQQLGIPLSKVTWADLDRMQREWQSE